MNPWVLARNWYDGIVRGVMRYVWFVIVLGAAANVLCTWGIALLARMPGGEARSGPATAADVAGLDLRPERARMIRIVTAVIDVEIVVDAERGGSAGPRVMGGPLAPGAVAERVRAGWPLRSMRGSRLHLAGAHGLDDVEHRMAWWIEWSFLPARSRDGRLIPLAPIWIGFVANSLLYGIALVLIWRLIMLGADDAGAEKEPRTESAAPRSMS